ncbi:glycogen debranching enzyme [Diaminobutyricimonas aerilata]|uniref:Glycogen debranching enzyme n=1 Tax=Diaminobutyricimonas aerilata TaxID=1162967 RepID=A0A2M9CNJ1_9MICO|nr:glycogen debranching N-terminal domain-containing protein [Diaminobutyricimonas aerilata]PJJ73469.1 glycogen debranching enzyme [Diaminobutyricimonas aerilata]
MSESGETEHLQPLLHDRLVVLRAPAQAWSAHDGGIGSAAIDGVYVSDVRVVRGLRITVDGRRGEHIATSLDAADRARFIMLLRRLDDGGADPGVRAVHDRAVTADGTVESLTLSSRLGTPIRTTVTVEVVAETGDMDAIKAGVTGQAPASPTLADGRAGWGDEHVSAAFDAPGAELVVNGDRVTATWAVTVPAHGEVSIDWRVTAVDAHAVVGPGRGPRLTAPALTTGDERLARWVARAVDDLDALRLETKGLPGAEFLAAGAPWFFTLFGRDSIWAARMLLPLGTRLAHGTLRVLAGLQGESDVAATAEQPGKIMHELRRATLNIPGESIALPPLYYGTVDATALWVCLLHDAWKWGLADDDVRELLPNLRAALAWMRDSGDSDGDGLLEYIDSTGHGLSNQGWKDSGDSVQWLDGTLAEGPIALCEVQAYAFEAATHGADLLEHFGEDGSEWRAWAARLKQRFDETFWIEHPDGAYPAIALDAQKRPVDTVTSNLGHLLGTGLLDPRQSALVARRLGSPQLDSGFGLRTMSTDSAGYWPLSYHGGTVWTHDTAIAIAGLVREGHREVADSLIRGLLAAASGFDYRMPELHSGDTATEVATPVPYPAACRPQAWSAAAAVSVLASTLGLEPGDEGLAVSPSAVAGAVEVSGLRFGDAELRLRTDTAGDVLDASGAPIVVG